MRPSRALSLLPLIFIAAWGTASDARAWTRTVVQSARAAVELEADATLSILLRLDVEVHAGWLHELELVDLGPDVELDRSHPPYLRSEDGEVFRPETELHEDGRIRLWFHRRGAPRRGEYRVFIKYRTGADARTVEVDGEPRVRVVWSVPTWETGLHDVSVEFRAPKGTVVPNLVEEASPGIDVRLTEGSHRTVVRWRRIHLPRMTPWPLTVDAPAGSIVLPASTARPSIPDGFTPLRRHDNEPIAWGLMVLAGLVLLKRRSTERNLGRQRLWLRLSWPQVLLTVAALLGAAQWLAPTHVIWGLPLVLFALHRPIAPAAPRARDWQRATLETATSADPPNPLDGTTLTGACIWIGCSAALIAIAQPGIALLLIPLFLSDTRHHRPPTAAEVLDILRAFASELALPQDAPPMCFGWERARDGVVRLRGHLSEKRSGLLGISFVVASSSLGLLRKRSVMLLVETRAQSEADDLMRRRTSSSGHVRDANGRVLRLLPWHREAIELLRVLAHKAPKPLQASRGTWLLREISERPRKAA